MELGLCLEDPLDHAERKIGVVLGDDREAGVVLELTRERAIIGLGPGLKETKEPLLVLTEPDGNGDRKSTRLNSSHVAISYAVFCLKKKKDLRCVISKKERTIAEQAAEFQRT